MTRSKLLCVDDDAAVRELYRILLGSFGYEVVVAENGAEALQLFRLREFDAVILDYEMPGMNGGELAAEIKRRSSLVPIIMVSGCQPVVEEAPRFVDAAVAKGARMDRLLEKLEMLLDTAASKADLGTPALRFASGVAVGDVSFS
jgi:CheY-like chemotaxis protein